MNFYTLIVFLPLLGFLVAGLFGRVIGAKASEYITSGLLVVSAALSWLVFYQVGLSGHPTGPKNHPSVALADIWKPQSQLEYPCGYPDHCDAGGGDERLVSGSYLFHWLYA